MYERCGPQHYCAERYGFNKPRYLILNERRGLQGYCAERRGLNIYMIFLYAAPRLSKLL